MVMRKLPAAVLWKLDSRKAVEIPVLFKQNRMGVKADLPELTQGNEMQQHPTPPPAKKKKKKRNWHVKQRLVDT